MPTPRRDDHLSLVADIGGTNARFAIVEGHGGGRPFEARTYRCADYPSLEDAAEHYLQALGGRLPTRAAIAVATALTDDQVKMTNHHWAFSVSGARKRLQLDELMVLNDFTALALSLPKLTADEVRQVGGGAPAPGTPIALIGPGTGLGVSGLVPAGDRYIPLQSEGGHVTHGAANHRQSEILAVIGRRYNHISAERLMSGPGLVNLYLAISQLEGVTAEPLAPAQITERAMAGDCDRCKEALDTFCAMLGTAAGNLVLTLGARAGAYIGGGIVPRLGEYFVHSRFRDAFEHRGRFSAYLAAVPSYIIQADQPALVGAAAALSHPAHEVGICSQR
jgi:glucokinase